MNTLKAKILGLITIIVIVIVTVASLINIQLQKQVKAITRQNTLMMSETIKQSILNTMHNGRAEELQNILSGIKAQESIKVLRIYDPSGKIVASADRGEIGRMAGKEELPTLISETFAHHDIPLDDKNTLDTISLFHNSKECSSCHDESKEILGVLEVNIGIDHLQSFFAEIRNLSFISTAFIIVLITLTISLFLIYYVNQPINQLIHAMQRVKQGEFVSTPVITSSDEMRLVFENHNRMVEQLREQIDSAINHERALARAQEKLSHHREIHHMNKKLEEQLREIENLNVELEERIEEIEEGNQKIANLAANLEEKNFNLEKAVAKLSTLHKLGLAINSTMDMSKLFNLVIKTTMATLDGQIGYITLIDDEKKALTVTSLLGHDVSLSPEGTMLPMNPSNVSTWVINNRKPLLIADINETPEFDRLSSLGYERKTLICAPLITNDETIGTITVVNKLDDSVYTNEELELLNTIAAQASIAIKNAKLYDEQQKNYLNTIHALVTAIEASDSYTRGHSERVTRYCMELARKLEFPQERLKILERAAILHDIGKIGIDLTLLNKEGKLTVEDIYDLQQHPVIGMNILEPIEFLQEVRICIGQHHERYDGRGYPNNVKGDGLLPESRILAIADAFDAMTTNRPYRKALPVDMAMQELIKESGSQFDPELVRHFVELLKNGSLTIQKPYDPRDNKAPAYII